MKKAIEVLKNSSSFALIGASQDKEKYGYKVFSTLKERYKIFPVNPKRDEIDGEKCYPSFDKLPFATDGVIFALSKEVTEKVLKEVLVFKPKLLWFPPLCFTQEAVKIAKSSKVPLLYDICPVAAFLNLKNLEKNF